MSNDNEKATFKRSGPTHKRAEDRKFSPAAILTQVITQGRATVNVNDYIAAVADAGETLTPADVANRVRSAAGMIRSGDSPVFKGALSTTADDEYVRLRLTGEPSLDADHLPRFVQAVLDRPKPLAFHPLAAEVLGAQGIEVPVRKV